MNSKKGFLKGMNKHMQQWFIENLIMLVIFFIIAVVAVFYSK